MTILSVWRDTCKKDAEIRQQIKSERIKIKDTTPSQGKEGEK